MPHAASPMYIPTANALPAQLRLCSFTPPATPCVDVHSHEPLEGFERNLQICALIPQRSAECIQVCDHPDSRAEHHGAKHAAVAPVPVRCSCAMKLIHTGGRPDVNGAREKNYTPSARHVSAIPLHFGGSRGQQNRCAWREKVGFNKTNVGLPQRHVRKGNPSQGCT